ncbi:lytic transglycosylase domain-containing protein [Arthrobacter sp. ISL-65]|uniref:lytic transglycosylase domain-containing protein n=1 Tax=Arthrobacter sp. ISL-65 TaxID=2819112 RepID=UPI001BE9F241|nr:lytic transglycosylase domain-containing protein [Arthrobacter sp. ISL-65]MBT2547714.1 lytic murein transglycosylase [Arthrobacter sp. ISL-65]
MLRMKRLAVLSLFAFCAITAGAFWLLGIGMPTAQPAPPQAAGKFVPLASGSKHAVNITTTVEPGWLARTAAQTGIPARALRAYVAAAGMANDDAPACGIGWNTVAAVGFVESAHGALGGGRLTASGDVSGGPIVGPGLNGDGFAAIADTDAGVLDGDARWDRAVGPMQFIPSTWKLAGRDANGDGVADPHNIDDAALSAAGYLCAGGRDLTTDQGWTDAIWSYNQSEAYLAQVGEQAVEYAEQAG